MLESCTLCPRSCKVNRLAGAAGYCTQDATVRLARAALHHWEEPPISGDNGSGTVFFSGCALHCAYCQNQDISNGSIGREVSIERLAQIFLEQQGRGAHNINLVTPSHFAPQIVEALRIFDGHVDIYLTDFKYAFPERAERYSRASDYPQVASAALDEMYRQVGEYREDPQTGLLEKGVVVRHLLLPGGLSDSFAVMRLLAAKPYARKICVSLMSQYTPMPSCEQAFPELAEGIDPQDYDALIDYALDLGLENSFCQEGEAASESFIPAFDYEGV